MTVEGPDRSNLRNQEAGGHEAIVPMDLSGLGMPSFAPSTQQQPPIQQQQPPIQQHPPQSDEHPDLDYEDVPMKDPPKKDPTKSGMTHPLESGEPSGVPLKKAKSDAVAFLEELKLDVDISKANFGRWSLQTLANVEIEGGKIEKEFLAKFPGDGPLYDDKTKLKTALRNLKNRLKGKVQEYTSISAFEQAIGELKDEDGRKKYPVVECDPTLSLMEPGQGFKYTHATEFLSNLLKAIINPTKSVSNRLDAHMTQAAVGRGKSRLIAELYKHLSEHRSEFKFSPHNIDFNGLCIFRTAIDRGDLEWAIASRLLWLSSYCGKEYTDDDFVNFQKACKVRVELFTVMDMLIERAEKNSLIGCVFLVDELALCGKNVLPEALRLLCSCLSSSARMLVTSLSKRDFSDPLHTDISPRGVTWHAIPRPVVPEEIELLGEHATYAARACGGDYRAMWMIYKEMKDGRRFNKGYYQIIQEVLRSKAIPKSVEDIPLDTLVFLLRGKSFPVDSKGYIKRLIADGTLDTFDDNHGGSSSPQVTIGMLALLFWVEHWKVARAPDHDWKRKSDLAKMISPLFDSMIENYCGAMLDGFMAKFFLLQQHLIVLQSEENEVEVTLSELHPGIIHSDKSLNPDLVKFVIRKPKKLVPEECKTLYYDYSKPTRKSTCLLPKSTTEKAIDLVTVDANGKPCAYQVKHRIPKPGMEEKELSVVSHGPRKKRKTSDGVAAKGSRDESVNAVFRAFKEDMGDYWPKDAPFIYFAINKRLPYQRDDEEYKEEHAAKLDVGAYVVSGSVLQKSLGHVFRQLPVFAWMWKPKPK